jgi:hypothetical protein
MVLEIIILWEVIEIKIRIRIKIRINIRLLGLAVAELSRRYWISVTTKDLGQ